MPMKGVSAKRQRQYKKIKSSAKRAGRSNATAERIAAATVNKQRAETGEAEAGSRKGSTRKRGAAKTSRKQRTPKKKSAKKK